jgi:hypothetical protein
MGIARRKSGTVVSCPTCQGQVVVPSPEPALQPVPMPAPVAQSGATGNVFERQDFDAGLFNPNPVPAPAAPLPAASLPQALAVPPAPSKSWGMESQPFFIPPTTPVRSRVIRLSTTQFMWLCIGAALYGLILFGLGVIVGKSV